MLWESWYLLLLSLRWFEPEVSNRARQIRIKDTRIPLNTVAARKGKAGQSAGCEVVCLKANREL